MKIRIISCELRWVVLFVALCSGTVQCAENVKPTPLWSEDIFLNKLINAKNIQNKIDKFTLVDITTLRNKLVIMSQKIDPAKLVKVPLVGSVVKVGAKSDVVLAYYDGSSVDDFIVCEKPEKLDEIKLSISNDQVMIVAPVENETQFYTVQTSWRWKKYLQLADKTDGNASRIGSIGPEFWLCYKQEKKCFFFDSKKKQYSIILNNKLYTPSIVGDAPYVLEKGQKLDNQEKNVLYWSVHPDGLYKLHRISSEYALSSVYKHDNHFIHNFVQLIPYTQYEAVALYASPENEKNNKIMYMSLDSNNLKYSTLDLETPDGAEKIALISQQDMGVSVKKLYCLINAIEDGYSAKKIKKADLSAIIKHAKMKQLAAITVGNSVQQEKIEIISEASRDMSSNSSMAAPVVTNTNVTYIIETLSTVQNPAKTESVSVSSHSVGTDLTVNTSFSSLSPIPKDSIRYKITLDSKYTFCVSRFKKNLFIARENGKLLCVVNSAEEEEIIEYENCMIFNIHSFFHRNPFFHYNKHKIEYIYIKDNNVHLFVKGPTNLVCYGQKIDQLRESASAENKWKLISQKFLPPNTTKIVGINTFKNMVPSEFDEMEKEYIYEGLLLLSGGCYFKDKTSFDFSSTVKLNTDNCGNYKDVFIYGIDGKSTWSLNNNNEIHVSSEEQPKRSYSIDPQYDFVKIVAVSDEQGFALAEDGRAYGLTLINGTDQKNKVIVTELTHMNELIYAQAIVPHDSNEVGIITKADSKTDTSAQYLTVRKKSGDILEKELEVELEPTPTNTSFQPGTSDQRAPGSTIITLPISAPVPDQASEPVSYFKGIINTIASFTREYIVNPVMKIWRSLWAPY